MTGLDPATSAKLDELLSTVDVDITAWKRYRRDFEPPMPGRQSLRKAVDVSIFLRRNERPSTTLDHRGKPMITGLQIGLRESTGETPVVSAPAEVDPNVASYLAARFPLENRQFLREMLGYGFYETGSMDLEQLFGVPAIPLVHTYECVVLGRGGLKGGAGFGGGVSARYVEIRYRNDEFGLEYRQTVGVYTGVVLAGFAVPMPKGFKGLPVEAESGGDVARVEKHPSFWAPEDFSGLVGAFEVAAEASAAFGPYGKGLEAAAVEIIGFQNGTDELDFVFGPSTSVLYATASPVNVEAWAGATGEMGVAIPYGKTRPWGAVMQTSVFFDTGEAILTEPERRRLEEFLTGVNDFKMSQPNASLRIDIVGQASPRWRRPGGGGIAHSLNVELSERRAEGVLVAVRGGLEALVRESMDFDLQAFAGPDVLTDDPTWNFMTAALGPDQALAEGADPDDNWQYHRRVDIVVRRTD